ncbi:MAG: T9SS type A sorting domain-containing protein [Ignavibacteriae bacterium]|nr:T9SS type A sorting domain-containing protein [Ignavibacteriota bacterium]
MKKLLLFLILVIISNNFLAQKKLPINKTETVNKKSVISHFSKFNVNNVSSFFYNDGNTDFDGTFGNSGFEYPKGTNKTAIFESGLVWGAKIDEEVRVGGSTYSQGLVGGKVFDNGTVQNPNDESVRVYRVRKYYKTISLSSEFEDEQKPIDEIRAQYEKDWNEWPAEFGAPFDDKNNNGIYESEIDIPGVPGADQTLWYVANDFDTATCRSLYGSDPMKIEMQVTIWGFNAPGVFKDVFFKKYKLINKSDKEFKEMYISQWADIDLGYAGDDLVGFDTLLNLMYSYNGDDYDEVYGANSPAIGFQFLQGPIIEEAGSVAYFDGQLKPGFKNLNISSSFFFIGGSPTYHDPWLGDYTGSLTMYNVMKALIPTSGIPFVDPTTNNFTKFTLAGNPVTGKGWIDGMLHPPDDRRSIFTCGPFNLAAGETQEVVMAEFANTGTDRLNSITALKEYAQHLKDNYPNYNINKMQAEFDEYVPDIVFVNSDNEEQFKLDIISNETIENYSNNGYKFQGFRIFELNYEQGAEFFDKLIYTFDINDNITLINNEANDSIIIRGTNSGIPDNFYIDKDYYYDMNLLIGKNYYYGISSYFYNETDNKVIETSYKVASKIFKPDEYGFKYLDVLHGKQTNGNSNVSAEIEIIDPTQITGNIYEIKFGTQDYYMDESGEWKKVDSLNKTLGKPNDLTGSTIIPQPSVYAESGTLNLYFILNLVAVDYDYSDGVSITFPSNVKINSAYNVIGNNRNREIIPIVDGQKIIWGNKDISGDGEFRGGEMFTVNIDFIDPTFSIDYEIYDDGWSKNYAESGDSTYFNLGNGIVHASGTATLTGEILNQTKTEKYWYLSNQTQNKIVLDYETILNGKDINTGKEASYGYEPIVDGLRIKVNGSFDNPINFENIKLYSPSGLSSLTTTFGANNYRIAISNYTVFGGVISSWAIDNFGVGTNDINILNQNYELRFTGVWDSTEVNGQKIIFVKEGGQIATCFTMVSTAALADHPLNPNPGVAEPFLIRIPFEVWNVEDPNNPYQVNLTYRDRMRDGTQNPFYSWNLSNRMYGIIVNSPYNPNQVIKVDNGPDQYNELATWVLVFTGTNYHLGDVVTIEYDNPIQLTDVYTFNTDFLSDISDDEKIPNKFELSQNYPNPFNPTTNINFSIPKEGKVKISIYNILGQKISDLVNQSMKAGKYETTFNGSNLASGIYIYRIEAANFVQSKKMMLLK